MTLIALVSSAAALNTVLLIIPQIVMLSPQTAGSATLTYTSMRNLVEMQMTTYGAIYNWILWAPFIAGALGIGLGWLLDLRKKQV